MWYRFTRVTRYSTCATFNGFVSSAHHLSFQPRKLPTLVTFHSHDIKVYLISVTTLHSYGQNLRAHFLHAPLTRASRYNIPTPLQPHLLPMMRLLILLTTLTLTTLALTFSTLDKPTTTKTHTTSRSFPTLARTTPTKDATDNDLPTSPPSVKYNNIALWRWMWDTLSPSSVSSSSLSSDTSKGSSSSSSKSSGVGKPNGYRNFFLSSEYKDDIPLRFPQWVDGFERVIHNKEEWKEWLRLKGYEKRWRGGGVV